MQVCLQDWRLVATVPLYHCPRSPLLESASLKPNTSNVCNCSFTLKTIMNAYQSVQKTKN